LNRAGQVIIAANYLDTAAHLIMDMTEVEDYCHVGVGDATKENCGSYLSRSEKLAADDVLQSPNVT
jgi:hypothetical protein